jgi:hypothetical protein
MISTPERRIAQAVNGESAARSELESQLPSFVRKELDRLHDRRLACLYRLDRLHPKLEQRRLRAEKGSRWAFWRPWLVRSTERRIAGVERTLNRLKRDLVERYRPAAERLGTKIDWQSVRSAVGLIIGA